MPLCLGGLVAHSYWQFRLCLLSTYLLSSVARTGDRRGKTKSAVCFCRGLLRVRLTKIRKKAVLVVVLAMHVARLVFGGVEIDTIQVRTLWSGKESKFSDAPVFASL